MQDKNIPKFTSLNNTISSLLKTTDSLSVVIWNAIRTLEESYVADGMKTYNVADKTTQVISWKVSL